MRLLYLAISSGNRSATFAISPVKSNAVLPRDGRIVHVQELSGKDASNCEATDDGKQGQAHLQLVIAVYLGEYDGHGGLECVKKQSTRWKSSKNRCGISVEEDASGGQSVDRVSG